MILKPVVDKIKFLLTKSEPEYDFDTITFEVWKNDILVKCTFTKAELTQIYRAHSGGDSLPKRGSDCWKEFMKFMDFYIYQEITGMDCK